MLLATVVGARPQFIKVAPVSKALQEKGSVREVLIHTGQHYDAAMSDVFFEELGIQAPDVNLGVHGSGHGAMTGSMMVELEPILMDLKPDALLVYGDTNSTLAGALVASKLHIPVAHVEAGLRSFNRAMPEELNRIATDHLSDILFPTTDAATQNLKNEGITGDKVSQVGDVMYDAALQFRDVAQAKSSVLGNLSLEPGGYLLSTVHRAENTDSAENLLTIFHALEALAADIPVVLPLHPRTRGRLENLGVAFSKVTVIAPVGYLDMVALESNAAAIITDSGGVQKEAFFYDVPCVTLREETEWGELIDLGWNRLSPPSRKNILADARAAIGSVGKAGQPYGDGAAALRIADVLSGMA